MNILQIHKIYWPRDGASNYALYLSSLLKKAGHSVIPFSTIQKENLKTPYSKYFVKYADLSGRSKMSFAEKLSSAGRILYSFEAKEKISRLLNDEKIDIAHLHNIYHHISPSILPMLKKHKIPVVMTLHDYKLVSPNYSLYHHGQIHDEDARGLYLSCIKNKCVKDSFVKSALSSVEMIFHHKIMKYYERYVDKFIAPSEFILNYCVKLGWNPDKFIHIPHPINTSKYKISMKKGEYVAYIGRLSEEKGLGVLLDACKKTPEILYKIAGAGPMEQVLKNCICKEKIKNIDLVGFIPEDKIKNIISNARMLVLPSVWYENYPISILEAKAIGKVVVASKIGGIPELLPQDMLVNPNDPSALAKAIAFWNKKTDAELTARGLEMRKEAEQFNSPERHIENIEEIYRSL
jgi:glycosyltransferase involved in cell wall biosynthesis